ncbi:MAG: T9SS type A sorting domain-containing protein [Lacibacter sp.]
MQLIFSASKEKKRIAGILFFVLLMLTANAQVNITSTFNTTGHSSYTGTFQLDWSVSELTSIDTYSNSNIIITNGILQGTVTLATGINIIQISSTDVKLFPNPARDYFTGNFQFKKPGKLEVQLIDIKGSVINAWQSTYYTPLYNKTFTVDKLPSGTYLLKVVFHANNGTVYRGDYKLIKVN